MYIKNLIINLFNLEVDSIEDFEIINDGCMTFVLITLKKRPAECPHCGRETSLINDYRRRVISHSILTERETVVVYRQRRMFCPHCGKAFAEHNRLLHPAGEFPYILSCIS